MDNALLASWLNGTAACLTDPYPEKLSTSLHILQQLVRVRGWSLRHPWADWAQWIPRERNQLADKLANFALDAQTSFAIKGSGLPANEYNVVAVSDGASRASTQCSAASWALLAFTHTGISMIAGGALLFDRFVTSQMAETTGFELALAAFMKLSHGYPDVVPHEIGLSMHVSDIPEIGEVI